MASSLELPLPVLADVSVLATIGLGVAVAAITALGTLLGSRAAARATGQQAQATIQASGKQAEATLEGGARTRFAHWQLHKREIYAEFLKAARAVSSAPEDEVALAQYLSQCDRVMLVANADLREKMWNEFIGHPERLRDATVWKELIEALGTDARRTQYAD